jgi:hypothetical protein
MSYRPEVLAELARHGMLPRPETPPEKVYELLKSLYTFEIREAKLRHREKERLLGPQPLDDYRRAVAALQQRYPVLRLPAHHWVERSREGAAGASGERPAAEGEGLPPRPLGRRGR